MYAEQKGILSYQLVMDDHDYQITGDSVHISK